MSRDSSAGQRPVFFEAIKSMHHFHLELNVCVWHGITVLAGSHQPQFTNSFDFTTRAVVGEVATLWPKEDVQVNSWSTTQLNCLPQTSFPRAPTTERRRLRNRSPVRSTGDNVLTIDRCVLNGQSPHCRLFLLLRLKENVQVIIPD